MFIRLLNYIKIIVMDFFENYYMEFKNHLYVDENVRSNLYSLAEKIKSTNNNGGIVFLLGNGGSNSICSHVAIDLSKNCGVRAACFSDASEISCLANDYGFDQWMSKSIELKVTKKDFCILISSSGCSENIVNAARTCKRLGINTATFTGMKRNNPLKTFNDNSTNFWVDSYAYNIIEMTHQFYLLSIVDFIIGKTVYESS